MQKNYILIKIINLAPYTVIIKHRNLSLNIKLPDSFTKNIKHIIDFLNPIDKSRKQTKYKKIIYKIKTLSTQFLALN